MKKAYISPILDIRVLETESLIAVSLDKYDDGGGDQLVKEDVSDDIFSSSRGGYNIWDDDWSK